MSETYTIADVRKELKKFGYKLRTKTYSEFIGADVISPEGNKINNAMFFSKEDAANFSEKHKDALDIIKKCKGKIFEGQMRVIL